MVKLSASGTSTADLPPSLAKMTKSIGVGSGEILVGFDEPSSFKAEESSHMRAKAMDPHELSLGVIARVNRIRANPKRAAAEMRERFGECFEGKDFHAPWRKSTQKCIPTKEGKAALDELCARLEKTPPLKELTHRPELYDSAAKLGHELADGKARDKTSKLEDRLRGVGTWSGVAGEAVTYGMRSPEAIVTMMLLCDGDSARKNRSFLLNPDVVFAVFALTFNRASNPIGVLSVLSHFYPQLTEEVSVEFQGPVEKRRRPMPERMQEVISAIPSDEAVDLILAQLAKGKHVRIDYKINAVDITVTDRAGKKKVSKLKWD